MKKVIKIGLLVIWICVIFLLSSEESNESNNKSNKVLDFVITIVEKISDKEIEDKELFYEKYTYVVRKAAHIVEYFILGFLTINCFSEFFDKRLILYSIIFCVLYSCSDELHQMFVPGRDGNIFDVLIDTFGSGLGIFIKKSINLRKK